MNKEQKTIAAIKKAVPEIMEVKRGCKVLDADGEIYDISSYIFPPCEWKINQHLIKKIIGRPITLFDVYDAVEKLAYREVKGIKFRHTKFGDVKTFKDDEIKLLHMWKRHKPFTEQPQKTKDFIGDLILNK